MAIYIITTCNIVRGVKRVWYEVFTGCFVRCDEYSTLVQIINVLDTQWHVFCIVYGEKCTNFSTSVNLSDDDGESDKIYEKIKWGDK